MRICNNCGSEIDENDDFCPECGAPVDQEIDQEPEEYFDEPDDHMKTCPQCGEYVPLDSNVCPSCQYVFYKKTNKKLLTMIGGGAAALVVVIVILVLLLGGNKKSDVQVVEQTTAEPITIATQEPAVDLTVEPTATPTTAPAATAAAESQSSADDPLASHHDEAMTVFELLEEAPAGEQSVTITAVDGTMKAVGTASAESYITKLLSLLFGDKAGFEYNLYLDGDTWRLVMSGTLKDEQLQKMLALEDDNIYATFRSMYLNAAREVIAQATGSQPAIMLSVYAEGKSGDDYALRLVETQAGNGTISRAETA